MSKFQYHLSGKKDREIWVCEGCRNANKESILTGKWKLIDRCGDSGIKCFLCEVNEIAQESKSVVAKNGL